MLKLVDPTTLTIHARRSARSLLVVDYVVLVSVCVVFATTVLMGWLAGWLALRFSLEEEESL